MFRLAKGLGLLGVAASLVLAGSARGFQQRPIRYEFADPVALARSLASKDAAIRCSAARALANLGEYAKEAAPALLVALSDEQPVVRLYSSCALGFIGPAARPAIKDSDEEVSRGAICALSKLGASAREAVPAIVKCLEGRPRSVRILAAELLYKFQPEPKTVVPALLQALQDEDEYVRDGAATSLKAINPRAAARAGIP
jgi:HEAT repeat protein